MKNTHKVKRDKKFRVLHFESNVRASKNFLREKSLTRIFSQHFQNGKFKFENSRLKAILSINFQNIIRGQKPHTRIILKWP